MSEEQKKLTDDPAKDALGEKNHSDSERATGQYQTGEILKTNDSKSEDPPLAHSNNDSPTGSQKEEKQTSFFDKNILQQIITVELFIGAVVVLWYAIIYSYQLGLKNYYGIPSFYIEVSITKLLEPGFYLSITMLSIMAVLFVSKIDFSPIERWNISVLYPVLFVVLFYLSLISMIGSHELAIILLFPVILGLVGVGFLFKNRNYNIFLYLILLMASVLIAYFAGGRYAASKEYYYILKENNKLTNKVVLDTYSEFYVVAPLDPKTKQIIRDFQLIEMKKEDSPKPHILMMDHNAAQSAAKNAIIKAQSKQGQEEKTVTEEEKELSLELRYTGRLVPKLIEPY